MFHLFVLSNDHCGFLAQKVAPYDVKNLSKQDLNVYTVNMSAPHSNMAHLGTNSKG